MKKQYIMAPAISIVKTDIAPLMQPSGVNNKPTEAEQLSKHGRYLWEEDYVVEEEEE